MKEILIVLLLAPALLAGCAGRQVHPAVPSADPATCMAPVSELWRQYCSAVDATRYPVPEHLSRELVAIARSTPELRWNERGEVLMVTLAADDCGRSDALCFTGRVHRPAPLPQSVWLSAAPFLQDFCRTAAPAGLGLRIRQRLGLPPDFPVDQAVEMWIDPRAFFRPCSDPAVTDRECSLGLPGETAPACPWEGAPGLPTAHLEWMCDNWRSAFWSPGEIRFPWTGLGYTWDWAADNPGHRGESEFVAPRGAVATVESVQGIEEYCGRH